MRQVLHITTIVPSKIKETGIYIGAASELGNPFCVQRDLMNGAEQSRNDYEAYLDMVLFNETDPQEAVKQVAGTYKWVASHWKRWSIETNLTAQKVRDTMVRIVNDPNAVMYWTGGANKKPVSIPVIFKYIRILEEMKHGNPEQQQPAIEPIVVEPDATATYTSPDARPDLTAAADAALTDVRAILDVYRTTPPTSATDSSQWSFLYPSGFRTSERGGNAIEGTTTEGGHV